ncbi:alkylation response protein AidB-like acyl-CoA dehydrogenase [Pseudorhodoferax soli]|uniref:Alkylation response protein AidB-like acyl-CoA dehydrogenase n=2 Tax=Pseudorhodoferax soli TaxID=545864 RepID=A0A368XKR3_9BURK|nr:alkylation response protein AidB-like acyl-CoA dehydrogenase [Pseudorhodoferax soli]
MAWPREFGGQGRSNQERYVVVEELLAAGAPVAAHWVAERQIGLSLLRFGTPDQCRAHMPAIARGESYFGACYSEPDVGSDLAAVRTKATRTSDGWLISGRKVWTSQAHIADQFFVLARSRVDGKKHDGLTMFIVPRAAAGVQVRPLLLLNGEHHFNEVTFDDVLVSDAAVVGGEGMGWRVIGAELAIERSGPERFLSVLPLLRAMVASGPTHTRREEVAAAIGELVARLRTLRAMSMAVAAAIEAGGQPTVQAALVKDLGTRFESDVVTAARTHWEVEPRGHGTDRYADLVAQAVMHAPTFTLRGGTNEVLRGIVARALGLR